MANKIIIKKSSTASQIPTALQLDVGELAVNLADQKLYSKNAGGTVVLVGTGVSTNVVLVFPFYNSSTVLDSIALLSNYLFPFFKANGDASNIPTTT